MMANIYGDLPPFLPDFRLVNYYGLPRYVDDISSQHPKKISNPKVSQGLSIHLWISMRAF